MSKAPAETPPEKDPLRDIVGLFDSGLGDLAEQHDAYIVAFVRAENAERHPWPL